MSKAYKMSDTCDMMLSKDWKEIFVAEHIQLLIRLKRLNDVVGDYYAGRLTNMPEAEIMCLLCQHHDMLSYHDYIIYRSKQSNIELPSSFEDYYFDTPSKKAE